MMKITLQVDRRVVAIETDYKPSDGWVLFAKLLPIVVEHMNKLLAPSRQVKPEKEGGEE